MSRALLNVRNLTITYKPQTGSSVMAVKDVSLRVEPGEVLGILGESGSGKSTVAAAIMRLLPATAHCTGSISLHGRDVLEMKQGELREVRGRHISIISQDPASSLNPVMRAGTQISEVLRAHTALSRTERKQRVHELLCEVGLDQTKKIAGSYPHQLSGGQRQRVAIAQAIACRPDLVIADEATSKLDAHLQIQIIELMSALIRRHGTALLWITHDPATLVGFADRVAIMHAGEMIEEGTARDIFRRPGQPYTQQLMRVAQQCTLTSSAVAGGLEYAD